VSKLKNISLFFALCISFFVGSIKGMVDNRMAMNHNRKVYLISNPRASLVQFLRMIGNRGDFKVMHIPANYAYCNVPEHDYTKLVEGWYREDAPTTYAQAKEDILKEAEKSNVFVGENTHTANEFLKANTDFLSDPRVQFLVLIREPHGSIIDYYEQKKAKFDELLENQVSKSMGFEGLYNLLVELKATSKGLPLIISTEDLYYNTNNTVQKVCEYLEIPFKEESLHWEDISKNFTTFEEALGWYTIELTDCSKKWHKDAISSTGFTEPGRYAVNTDGQPTFSEIENENHRAICRKAYEENLVYYDKIKALIQAN